MIVFLTGASGLLGRSVYERFLNEPKWTVFGISFKRTVPGLKKLNLLDKDAVTNIVNIVRPDVIVHCAAERFPDKVDKDPQGAYDLNVGVSAHLADVANKLDVPLLYISTDYVFDGDNSPYKETDNPTPINEYGRLKLLGEKAVLATNLSKVSKMHVNSRWMSKNNLYKTLTENIVLRIPVLYGQVESLEESAITYLLIGLKKCQDNNELFKVSNYELRNPSSANDIAHIIFNLVEKKLALSNLLFKNDINGIYQWCGKETFTKYGMVDKMAQIFGLSMERVVPVNEEQGRVKRPFNTLLDVSRINQLGIGKHTNFEDGIKFVLASWVNK